MLRLDCPWCGPRDVGEFSYGSEAHIARPVNPAEVSDAAWADYLFMKTNPKGLMRERWVHAHGCRRWFNVVRHTVTDQVLAVYAMGAKGPGDTALLKRVGIADAPRVGPGEGLVAGVEAAPEDGGS